MLIPRLSDSKAPSVATMDVACCNWPGQFPYSPQVKASVCHLGDRLLLKFDVREKYTAALVDTDNGIVWDDSCVEFFIAFEGDEGYYNLEANCTGHVLLAHRLGQNEGVELAPEEMLAQIVRTPSLGREPFAERVGDNRWTLELEVPVSCFFLHHIRNLSGCRARCNVYKCGDRLSEPHYLSWRPVLTETPQFHRPEFFAPIEFE